MSVLRCFCASMSTGLNSQRVLTGRCRSSQPPASLCLVGLVVCRSASGAKDKQPLKKAKTPQGRLDLPEEMSRDVLQKFPDDVNPVTKEKGGPRGPEPTRYGDWERKGRCVDF
ncbi:succinate dehydrogenase assembly factor 4, mitochondrial [Betta splendens]|uniref:Succinate dehydrogenase assembly factor 4, mitochondrial n=1 Tax=Betta splendens TaxID=158456 RepID=A0A6P7PFU2_BETSP|nr:succinate dehydrogenase assembly factor 4, mitochondrial [Betta splendens]